MNIRKNTILILSMVAFLLLSTTISFASSENAPNKKIIVKSDAVVKIKPDTANISFSVVTENKNQTIALEENNKKANKLIEELKKFGINEKDIVTESISVSTVVDYEKDPTKTIGYRANNTMSVRTTKLDNLSKIINLGMKSGASSLNNVYYSSSKNDQAYLSALELAIKNSNKKAETIAKALGVKEYNVSLVEETSNNILAKGGDTLNLELTVSDSSAETPIIMQDLEVYASIKAEYQY